MAKGNIGHTILAVLGGYLGNAILVAVFGAVPAAGAGWCRHPLLLRHRSDHSVPLHDDRRIPVFHDCRSESVGRARRYDQPGCFGRDRFSDRILESRAALVRHLAARAVCTLCLDGDEISRGASFLLGPAVIRQESGGLVL